MKRAKAMRSIPAAAGFGLLLVFSLLLCGCSAGGTAASAAGMADTAVTERIVEAIPEEEMAAAAAAAEQAARQTGEQTAEQAVETTVEEAVDEAADDNGSIDPVAVDPAEVTGETAEPAAEETVLEKEEAAAPAEETAVPEEQAPVTAQPVPAAGQGRIIVLDPGHSANIPSGSEPLGPGASEMKAKDTVGTRGTATGVMEYELVFNVCLALQNELTSRGYTVYMTRSSHSDSVSCSERAAVANNAGAAVFLRVHADGAESASAHGASVLCISAGNPYTAATYPLCRKLSDCVLTSYCAATGCYNRGVFETDQMSGNNWSQVPTALIELGFMTNPEEDTRMETADYQALMVQGMANGIDAYFASISQ